SIQLNYGATATRPASGDWPLTVLASASELTATDDTMLGYPNTTMDGHPAQTLSLSDGGEELRVFNVNGVFVVLQTHSAATTASLEGGLKGLFRAMAVHP